MLSKAITFTDFNGVERTQIHYFNLSKSELMEWEIRENGTLKDRLQQVVDARVGSEIMDVFKDLIFRTYGVKSEDGIHFQKSEAISLAFSQSPAYDVLFYSLITEADAAAAFVNGLLPQELVAAQAEAQAVNGFRPGHEPKADIRPGQPTEGQPAVSGPVPPAATLPEQSPVVEEEFAKRSTYQPAYVDEDTQPTAPPEAPTSGYPVPPQQPYQAPQQ